MKFVYRFVLLNLLLSPHLANAECWTHYKRALLSEHLAKFPLKEYERWNHYALFREGKLLFANSYLGNSPEGVEATIRLVYSDEIRTATSTAKQAVSFFGGEKVSNLYLKELHVSEQGYDGWILVQETLIPHLKKELRNGDIFDACLVLVGRTNEYQLYIMNEFDKK